MPGPTLPGPDGPVVLAPEAVPTFRPVRTVRLYERIVEQIEAAIDAGELRPGQRLPSERELVGQFGASRATVREAMRVLQAAGVLESRPGDPRGPRVVTPGPHHLGKQLSRLAAAGPMPLADLVGTRMILEAAATRLAARLRTPGQIEDLADAVAQMQDLLDGSVEAFTEADLRFHDVVARASRNPLVQVCTEAVRGVVVRLVSDRIVLEPGAGPARALKQRSLDHHREVLAAIVEGDGERAARDVTRSLYAYYAELLDPSEREPLVALLDD